MKKYLLLLILAIILTGCANRSKESNANEQLAEYDEFKILSEYYEIEKVIEIIPSNYEHFSISEETAIKISRALLEEHFPDVFLNKQIQFKVSPLSRQIF